MSFGASWAVHPKRTAMALLCPVSPADLLVIPTRARAHNDRMRDRTTFGRPHLTQPHWSKT